MRGLLFIIIILVIVALRAGWRTYKKSNKASNRETSNRTIKSLTPWQRNLYTVWVFFGINLRRVFRDRVALFFTFLFPLIFLFVFGGIFGRSQSTSFNVAIINDSHSQ